MVKSLCQLEVNSVKLSSPFRTNIRPCNKFRFKIDFLDLFTVVLMLQSHEIENYAHPDKRLFIVKPKVIDTKYFKKYGKGLRKVSFGQMGALLYSWGRVKCK